MNNKYKFIIIVALLLATVIPGHAYVTHGRWMGINTTMRAAQVSFPSGNAYRTALGTVVSRYYYDNPSDFWFSQSYDEPTVAFDNGESEVWFTADSAYNPAWTFWWYNWLGYMDEADVVFYNGEAYTPYMVKTNLWSYGGSYRPFETTAIHEYGHAAGLSHEADEYNIMGQDWTHIHCNGSTARSYVGEDACDGLVALYGLYSGGTIEDLSVSLFKRTGYSGEYSTHNKCKMYTSGGSELGYSTYDGQRRYNVSKGQAVKVEFTWENEGETTQTRTAGWYISTNNTISTADTRFATQSFTLSRGDVFTYSTYITIPSNLTSGQTYYLGVIIDYDNGLSEIDESNNAAYHVIKVN